MDAKEKVLLVSSDGHAGIPRRGYRDYVDPRYHEDFDGAVEQQEAIERELMSGLAKASSAFADDIGKVRAAHAQMRFTDPYARLHELEENGVAVEVLFPAPTQGMTVPWAKAFETAPARTAREVELRTAGERAYNRWLAEFCAATPGRRIGLAYLPWHDVDAAIAEVRWAASAGLRGVLLPIFQYEVPEYSSAHWEPLWSVIEDVGFTLNVHGGFGLPDVHQTVTQFEHVWFTGRPFWHLALSGTFDRHPGLRMALTEAHAHWIPEMLERADVYVERLAAGDNRGRPVPPLPERLPSEYWHSNGGVGVSIMTLEDFEQRCSIGVDTMMFGVDYPHPEGSWGQAVGWLQASIAQTGITEAEARAILGLNAARFYDLDVEALAPVVDRIGPSIDDVLASATREQTDELFAAFEAEGRYFNIVNFKGGRDFHSKDARFFKDIGVR